MSRESEIRNTAYRTTPRNRVRRLPKRGHYDRETVHRVLDQGLIAHIGYVIDGQPYVTPTCYWREGEQLYWHGSSASRMLRAQKGGLPVCLTVTHFDGLVLARSAFHHSINYRSVMAFGTARIVDEPAEKAAALEAFVERVAPGRWAAIRGPNRQELKATMVIGMTIEEAVAKIRQGPPVDDEADHALDVWAGLVPTAIRVGAPVPDPLLRPGIAWPEHLNGWTAGANVDDILVKYEK
ncbi:MAG: pyridoxamine 5'-phosphate oxidase family protein [Alphaproteobacteria bacterium]|nr:pyridoxamine 5'-phosphate oxidase family protein [Alphaproteobacteria bacterium]MCW5752335.1 pyridoxamine 5'-phosphate oxidase family protein [Alphaproteobacteria bacterium]